MSSGNNAIYVDDDNELPSESDDEDEVRDCVHDIHGDGEEADIEDEEESQDKVRIWNQNNQTSISKDEEDSVLETERRNNGNDSSMDGDIEDADGMETERRNRQDSDRRRLKNKISGSVEQPSMDSDYFKKKSMKQGFPLNQMRRRQSGGIIQSGSNQPIASGYQNQLNASGDKPPTLANSYQDEKQMLVGTKGLLAGQQKIKLNSSQA